ncbi:hypothetical protein MSP8886_03300 [Marinomonas spartinae]|uniref:Uncharacterized protein n=1 Tax=Marinomonas spartinae TaxID=1792290 RepID=A0A1A8TN23_9GAMM|nr:hypothetical protein [Marinomonas spartinae]SBS35182.1 hypothetical protein MSP8886_03300 [Marinomonas spartinae]
MKLEISEQHLMLLVSALNDAITYNEKFLSSETIKDVSDYEEHLLCLENCQGWLEEEYERIATENSNLLPYSKLVRRM